VFLIKRFQEVVQAQCPEDHPQNSENGGRQEIWVRWTVPEGGWYILNTDGAAKGNPGRDGAGGVLRGDRGEWILGFAENLGVCSSVKAEIRAILRGLKLAKAGLVPKLWIQADSNVVVRMLTNAKEWHPEHSFILHQCKQLMEGGGWEVKISHCLR